MESASPLTDTSTTTSTGNVTLPADSVSPTITSQEDNTTSINNTALGAVIGVLVALVAVVLITHVCIALLYMYKKKSAVHQERYHSNQTITCLQTVHYCVIVYAHWMI